MKTEFPLLYSLVTNGDLPGIPPNVKLIEAQEATDKYWLDENDVWELRKDFGCMAPPYPFMWIESTAHMPASKPVNGKITSPDVKPVRMGFKVEAYSEGQFMDLARILRRQFKIQPCNWVYMFEMFTDLPHWPSITSHRYIPARGYMSVDAQGAMVQCWVETEHPDPSIGEYMQELLWASGKAAFYAISMMNCRNVDVLPALTATRRAGKKTRRQPKPPIEYHRIKLPTPKASGGGVGTLTGTTKLHTARGHFKTYTEDAPLMGKHVGTYYWGWQVRGRRENGEVISSYEVGAA